jgi:hypothetical protein
LIVVARQHEGGSVPPWRRQGCYGVVEEGDGAQAVAAGDGQFLVQFAFDGAAESSDVKRAGSRVLVIDVAAQTEREACVQAGFPAGTAAGVAKDLLPVAHHEVGTELFVRRIFLGFRAREKKVVGRIEEGRQIVVDVEGQPLEGPQAVEECARHDENIFRGRHGGGG